MTDETRSYKMYEMYELNIGSIPVKVIATDITPPGKWFIVDQAMKNSIREMLRDYEVRLNFDGNTMTANFAKRSKTNE